MKLKARISKQVACLTIASLILNISCKDKDVNHNNKTAQLPVANFDTLRYSLKRTRVVSDDSAELWVNKQDTSDYIIRQFRNNKLESYSEYKQNLKNGYWLICYDDGKKWREWHYKNDKLDGIFAVYDRKGRLVESGVYMEDLLLESKNYDPPLEPKKEN